MQSSCPYRYVSDEMDCDVSMAVTLFSLMYLKAM